MREDPAFKYLIDGIYSLRCAMAWSNTPTEHYKITVDREFFDHFVTFVTTLADGNFIRPETFAPDHITIYGVRIERGR